MNKWIAILVGAVFIIFAAVFFLLSQSDNGDPLDEAAAMESVVNLYGGEAEGTEISGGSILVHFSNADGKYTAAVDRDSGKVTSIELIEKTGPAQNIDEQQAQDIALGETDGEIEETVYSKELNEYEVTVAGEAQRMIIAISAETGEVRRISTEEVAEAAPDPPEETPSAEPDRILSRDEAVAIARQTLDGEVQEVQFIETADGGYYLVEIDNEASDQEATIQIHAIRGDTLTVDWDD